MKLTSLSIKRPVSAIMLLFVVIGLGVFSAVNIPLDLMPEAEYPVAIVVTRYADAGPEEVEKTVTIPLETSLASVENLKEIISYSAEGVSIVGLRFQYDTDMDAAADSMREKIDPIREILPGDVSQPVISKMSFNSIPNMQLYLSSDSMDMPMLKHFAEDTLKPRIERVNGVAAAEIVGAPVRETSVKLSQEELASFGLTLPMIAQQLAAENINLPGGTIGKKDSEIIVRTDSRINSTDDLALLPVNLPTGGSVRLSDIASISDFYKQPDSLSISGGQRCIGIMITKQADGNSVAISLEMKKLLKELAKKYPDMTVSIGFDQADFIVKSLKAVATSALLGAIFATIVVFLFLRNARSTLIIAISIPTSLLAAFAIMHARQITLNLVTLCALTVVVGMLVDNSIVVLENIFRTRQRISDSVVAAEKGTAEILAAIVASTLTTVTVFLPIAASGGISAVLFADFCWTVIIALIASLLVSITIIPMLASKIMRGEISTDEIKLLGKFTYKYRRISKFAEFAKAASEYYEDLLQRSLARSRTVIISCVTIFLVSISLLFTVGWELLPNADENLISIDVKIPHGTSLQKQEEILMEIDRRLKKYPEIEEVSMTGSRISEFAMPQDAAATVRLKKHLARRRSSHELARLMERDLADITAANIKARSVSGIIDMFGEADISLLISGKDRKLLEEIAYNLAGAVKEVPSVKEVELDIEEVRPEMKIEVDRNTASYYGISSYQIADALSSALSGKKATDLKISGDRIDVKLSIMENENLRPEDLKNILLPAESGNFIPLGQIAKFTYADAPAAIKRQGRNPCLQMNINIKGGSMLKGGYEVSEIVRSYPMPEGYFIDIAGINDEMNDAFSTLAKALLLSIILVFLLLAAQFESMRMSFAVMMAVPFAMSGAFLALFITGTALSLTSFLGLVILVGIVVNNSILLVEFIKRNESVLGTEKAVVQAGKMRLRPILMSSLTTVFGMLPLAFGLGEGSEVLSPMAISIIGGLIASTAVTLIFVPVLYAAAAKNKKGL